MSGHVGDLSPQQTETLEKFRAKVGDQLKPNQGDFYLLRWLRARDFDLKKAESMMKDALAWRKQIGADTILQDYKEPEVIRKFRTGGLLGYDKQGCPIYIDPYGLIDMKGLLRSVKKQELIRKFVEVMETVHKMCDEQSAKHKREIAQLTVIYDLDRVGVKHLWKPAAEAFLHLVDLAESKYPETLRRVFVINSPRIFPIIWSLVKPLLHENTAKKVHVLAGNFKGHLLKEIDADQLPKCYGGTKTDPDGNPRCTSWICQGGTIPKDYYNQPVASETMSVANVGRGSSERLEYEVKKPNSIIRYEFYTEGYDISFGVFRRTSDEYQKTAEMETILATERSNSHLVPEDGMVDCNQPGTCYVRFGYDVETILATERSNSHLVPEDGIVKCNQPGTYIFRFDNTYSWARSKKIYHNIEVMAPEEKSLSDDEDDEFVMAPEADDKS